MSSSLIGFAFRLNVTFFNFVLVLCEFHIIHPDPTHIPSALATFLWPETFQLAAAAAMSYYNVHTHKGFHKFLGSFHCRFAFQYNPSLQPRALVVFGCISKRVSHGQIKQIIRILSKVPIPLFPKICSNLQCILQGFKNTLKRNKCYWHCNYIFVKHLNFFSYCNSLKWWNLT